MTQDVTFQKSPAVFTSAATSGPADSLWPSRAAHAADTPDFSVRRARTRPDFNFRVCLTGISLRDLDMS